MALRVPQTPPYAEGPADAEIMLVGQNPGSQEVRTGRPFVGRSGKFLDKVLGKYGLNRKELYITPVVKEPTPQNRKPTAREISRWMPVLIHEIQRIKPRIILLMGRVAWETPRYKDIEYIETYHPAAAMRFPKIRERFEKDMEELKRRSSHL